MPDSQVISNLRRLVVSDNAACDYMCFLALQQRSARETTAAQLSRQLREGFGTKLSPHQSRRLLKDIAKAGAGVYTQSTRKGLSRIRWFFKTMSVGKAVHNEGTQQLSPWDSRSSANAFRRQQADVAKVSPSRSSRSSRKSDSKPLQVSQRDINEPVISVKCTNGNSCIEITAPFTRISEPEMDAAIASAMKALDVRSPSDHPPTPMLRPVHRTA